MARIRETLDARQTVLSKEIFTDLTHSGACIFQIPIEVSRAVRNVTTPWDGNTSVAAARSTSPVQICHSITNSPIRNRNQDIINPIGPVSPQLIRNAQKLKTSINGFVAEDRGLKKIFSKVVG